MNANRLLLTLICSILITTPIAPALSQAPLSPEAVQINGLRKELKRQRQVQDTLKKELKSTRDMTADFNQRILDQNLTLEALKSEQAKLWGYGAYAFVALLFLLLFIAMRRPRATAPPQDELQMRLAALDQKLRDLSR